MTWRTKTAIALAVVGGLFAGYGLSLSGFGFFPAWLFLTITFPAVVSLVTESRHPLVAALSVTVMMGFLLFRVFVPASNAFPLHPDERRGVIVLMVLLTLFSVLVAGGTGMIIAAKRQTR